MIASEKKVASGSAQRRFVRRTAAWIGRKPFLALVAVLIALPLRAAELPLVSLEGFVMKSGHDERWSSVGFDDHDWTPVNFNKVQATGDSIWLRKKVDTTRVVRGEGRPLGLYVAAIASHEIWWDGERIGSGGVVGRSAAAETPGPIDAHYQIPDRLAAPGVHLLAVRTSAFHRHFTPRRGYWAVLIGDYDTIAALHTQSSLVALMALSGIVLTAAFGLAMFATRRDRAFLLLGTLCIAAAALLIAEKWRPLFGYTYDLHIVRLLIIAFLSWVVGVHVVALMAARFPMKNGARVLFVTAAIATAGFLVPGWDTKAVFIFLVCFTTSLVWAIRAVTRNLPGSALAVTGIVAILFALAAQPLRFVDDGVYFALNFLFICLLCSHARQVRADDQKRTDALLKTARLELEATKRHMQPHFLMNTLTALSEWIEQDPKTAIVMIDALAEEMRTLGHMSAERLVSADDELRLCRSHLTTMSLRKDISYTLETDGFDSAQLVPPTVFHTLVENAVTHGPSSQRNVLLRLAAMRKGDRMHYTFESPLEQRGDDAVYEPGDGTRYIEARLSEVWGDAWSLFQAPVGSHWQVRMEVPA